ncbi:MAG: peptidoglycan-binding domain-containing protein [Beijerinckiaceae bacterium]|nr:peptidoglycan-binding domain-containing protein [Beijerinckiaceae bacterium]
MKQRNRAQERRLPEDEDRPRRTRRRLVTGGRAIAALACLFGGTIIVNAVMMQNEKHPTPLFRNAIREAESFPAPPLRPEPAARQAALAQPAPPTTRPVQAPAAPPAPVAAKPAETPAAAAPSDPLLADIQRELARRGFYKGEVHGRPGTATTQAIRDYQFSQRVPVDGRPSEALLKDLQTASRAAMRDELADLLKRNGTERPAAEDKPSRTVLDVQRALNKAGYGPLTEDGQMGPSTRNALSKFEADRKLPPRGEPKGPVLKLLASTTGIAIANP